jgi:hypothetical protein
VNEKDLLEQSLRGAYAPHEPDTELEQKVRSLKPRSSRKSVWVACGAAGLAAASLAVFLVLPATGLAEAVIKQVNAFEGHLDIYMVLPSGRWVKTGDQWIKGGKERAVDSGVYPFEVLHDPSSGYNIHWSADNGTVRIRSIGPKGKGRGGDAGSPIPEILTLQNMKDFLASHGLHGTPDVDRIQFNGRPADCITFSMSPYVSTKLYADPATQRMLGWSYRNTKVWPLNSRENNYTRVFVADRKPFPPHIFDPVFDINGVPTDVLAERAKWQERLSKPLKVYSVKLVPRPYLRSMKDGPVTRSVTVRSVVVNQAGDVFVLFTGGDGDYGTNVIPSTIHDATGGRYKKSFGFQPTEDRPARAESFNFDGKPLLGSWFVRLGGGELKGPISVGFKQEFEREDNLAFIYTAEPERIEGDIPGYMPYMFLAIGTHDEWLESRTDEFASDRDRAKDFAGEERYLRQLIALQGERDHPFRPAELLYQLGHALEQQGKKREAYAAYVKARKAMAGQEIDPDQQLTKSLSSAVARLAGVQR